MSLLHRAHRSCGYIVTAILILLVASSIPLAQAEDESPCPMESDLNPMTRFKLSIWVTRGVCIRFERKGSCDTIMAGILKTLVKGREAEYAGAASVLSLLPTIGALFGAPTSEIWRLKSIVPFGGLLAMGLSFGGALMPVNVEDYENTVSRRNSVAKRDPAIGSIISLRKQSPGTSEDKQTIDQKLQVLCQRTRERIDQCESVRLPKWSLIFGILGMMLLLAMAQSAMVVAELGAVVNWWCTNFFWMHFWYFLVTFTAFTEDQVQRPFTKTYKLYLSSLPYEVEISGGQGITDYFSNHTPSENVAFALKQLKTLRPASLTVHGSTLRTRARNSVMVMVSIAGEGKTQYIWRLLSKTLSVAVFVTGTAIFASVVFLSLIIAIVVLTLTLAAGIFGRAIASWIVGHVSGTEPMIHVITDTEQEAYQAIIEVLCLKSNDGTPFQVEIDGHIFISERRVASRSWLKVAILGVLADPYDVARTQRKTGSLPADTMSLSLLGSHRRNLSSGDISPPLPPKVTDSYLPTTRIDEGVTKSMAHQSVHNISADSGSDQHLQIPRVPVPPPSTNRG